MPKKKASSAYPKHSVARRVYPHKVMTRVTNTTKTGPMSYKSVSTYTSHKRK